MRTSIRALVAISVLAAATLVRAEARLADVVPADAVVYMGWAGTDALGAKYEKSNAKGMVDAVAVSSFINALAAEAEKKAGGDAKKLADLKLATSIGADLAKYPVAFYFGGVDLTGEKPMPKIAIIVKSGKERAAVMAADLQKDMDQDRKPENPPSAATAVGEYLLVTVGKAENVAPLIGGKGEALSAKKEFVAALREVGKDPALVVYAGIGDALKLADDGVALKGDRRMKDMWPKVMEVLGVDGAKYGIWAGGFDGAEWADQAFVALKERRTGLLSFFDHKPLSDDAVKMIPKGAVWAGVLRFDGDRLLTDLREAAGRVDDNAQAGFDRGLQAVTQITGVDIQRDLLASLGDEWVYYGVPAAGGDVSKSLVVVNKLRDAALAEQALGDLEMFFSGIVAQRGAADPAFDTVKNGEQKTHVISWKANGGGKVAWGVRDGSLYIALSAESLQAAMEHAAKKGANLSENAGFADIRKKLGEQKVASFSYADLPALGENSYNDLVKLIEKAQAKENGPKPSLPAYEKVKPYLSPLGSVSWSDEQGWHLRSRGPFPGAALVFGGLPTAIRTMAERAEQARAAQGGDDAVEIGTGDAPAKKAPAKKAPAAPKSDLP